MGIFPPNSKKRKKKVTYLLFKASFIGSHNNEYLLFKASFIASHNNEYLLFKASFIASHNNEYLLGLQK